MASGDDPQANPPNVSKLPPRVVAARAAAKAKPAPPPEPPKPADPEPAAAAPAAEPEKPKKGGILGFLDDIDRAVGFDVDDEGDDDE